MTPREYWAFAFKARDGSVSKEKREAGMTPREYWAFAFKTRDGSVEKRATLETNCEQADEGIYCTYAKADMETYGSTGSTTLEEYCTHTADGVVCFYPSDALSVSLPSHSFATMD